MMSPSPDVVFEVGKKEVAEQCEPRYQDLVSSFEKRGGDGGIRNENHTSNTTCARLTASRPLPLRTLSVVAGTLPPFPVSYTHLTLPTKRIV